VLPILWGTNLVGRIDAKFDRNLNTLSINSVYAEPGYGDDGDIGERLSERVEDLRSFLGADKILYGKIMPEKWRKFLSGSRP